MKKFRTSNPMLRTFTAFLLLLIFSTSIFVSSIQAQETYNIPSWIKSNAKWWSQGQIGDSDFTKGIQYLIQQGIMKLPQTNAASNPSHGIPTWVKNNAKWWSEGQIDDSQFVQGMQYLVQADIIHVNTFQQANQTTNQAVTSPITCKAVDDILPDPTCTPGAIDPTVTQSNIGSTICVSGYTKTVRPPVSVTNPIKLQVMQAYGFTDSPSNYELDHLIPLELGGAPADVKNLWSEPYYTNPNSYDKDGFENYLHNQVCSGVIDLHTAQNEIATNWVKYWEESHSVTSNQPTQTVNNTTSQASQTSSTTQSAGTLHIDLQGQSTISRGSIQSITVTITDGKNPVSGSSVSVLVTYASGETTKNFDGTTDSNGQYSFSWRIGGNSTPGTFGVDVDASKNGYASDHETFSFEVVPAS
jgi:hypothetical protein